MVVESMMAAVSWLPGSMTDGLLSHPRFGPRGWLAPCCGGLFVPRTGAPPWPTDTPVCSVDRRSLDVQSAECSRLRKEGHPPPSGIEEDRI